MRQTISGWPNFPLPQIAEVIERTVQTGRLTNPDIRCVGVALNTSRVPAGDRVRVLAQYERESGLPCVDPLIDGVAPIVDLIQKEFAT